jgi:FMN-dependent NADH-azoreductase
MAEISSIFKEWIMTCLLHLDASARPGRAGIHPHGSLTRRLGRAFTDGWRTTRPSDRVVHRDLGADPPGFIDGHWVQAAFASEQAPWMAGVLAESEVLITELLAADVLVIGAPLYNFGMPAALKAWVDNVVRIGRTFDFDPGQPESPYVPLLRDRHREAVILSARGGHGFGPGGELAHMNHLEPALRTILGFIGIGTVHAIAVEHQEDGGERLAASLATAEARVVELVGAMQTRFTKTASSAAA